MNRKRIKVPVMGSGTDEDPFRPRFVSRGGKELGKDLSGITWEALEVTDTHFLLSVREDFVEQLRGYGISFTEERP